MTLKTVFDYLGPVFVVAAAICGTVGWYMTAMLLVGIGLGLIVSSLACMWSHRA